MTINSAKEFYVYCPYMCSLVIEKNTPKKLWNSHDNPNPTPNTLHLMVHNMDGISNKDNMKTIIPDTSEVTLMFPRTLELP